MVAVYEVAQRAKLGRSFRRSRRLHLLQEAENAADKHDMRRLYQLVEQTAPRKRRTQMHIKTEQGELQTKAGMHRDLRDHYRDRFNASSRQELFFHAADRMLPSSVTLTMEELAHSLRKIPLRKAVPAGWAPGPVWRACADVLTPLLQEALQTLWVRGGRDIPTSWVNACLIFLIKAGKQGHKAADYRPIGLLCPLGKAVLAAITTRVSPYVHSMAGCFPLHGYIPGRGTHSALRQVFQHCEEVRRLCMDSATTIHDVKAGKSRPQCVGGLQIFIDLSKAFDVMPRSKLYEALLRSGAPKAEVELIMMWHVRSQYFLNEAPQSPGITTTRGVRQGCKAAPTLWLAFSALCCELLDKKLYPGWCAKHLVVYADDHHVSFCFRTLPELEAAVHAMGIVYTTLHAMGVEVSAPKSACIFTCRGTLRGSVHKRFVGTIKDQKVLKIPNGGSMLHIPIVSEHTYLGTVVSYSNFETQTLQHRANLARTRYYQLKTVINNRSHISRRDRLKMWMTCIWATLSCGLVECGVTKQGCIRLQSMMLQHIRAIVASPAHIDRISDAEVLLKYKLLPPHSLLLQLATKRLENACHSDPERSWTAWFQSTARAVEILDSLRALQADLAKAEVTRRRDACVAPVATTPPAAAPADSVPLRSDAPETSEQCTCDLCGKAFDSQRALRVHKAQKHHIQTDKTGTFSKAEHASGGMPTCRGCGKKFSRWSGLDRHIQQHRCPKEVRVTDVPDAKPASDPHIATVAAIQQTPEAMRILHQHGVHQFALHAAYGHILKQTCAWCGQWIASPYMVKNHFHNSHPDLMQRYKSQLSNFLSDIVPASPCAYCTCTAKVKARHIQSCAVLFQAAMLLASSQDGTTSGPTSTTFRGCIERGSQSQTTENTEIPAETGQGQREGREGLAKAGQGDSSIINKRQHRTCDQHDEPTHAQARRGTVGVEAEHRVVHVPPNTEARVLRGRHTREAIREMEPRGSERCTSRSSPFTMHPPAGPHPGTPQQVKPSRSDRRSKASGLGAGERVDLSGLVPKQRLPQSQRDEARDAPSDDPRKDQGSAASSIERRRHSQIPLAETPQGAHGKRHGCDGPGFSNSPRECTEGSRADAGVAGEFRVPGGGPPVSQRVVAALGIGTRAPADVERLHVLSLRNGSQICYANSVLLAYMWCTHLSSLSWLRAFGRAADPIQLLLQVHRPTLTSFDSLGFLWRDWPRPHIQHDASEFRAHFLLVTGCIACVGEWEARKHIEVGVQVMVSGSSAQAITIPVPTPNQCKCVSQHGDGNIDPKCMHSRCYHRYCAYTLNATLTQMAEYAKPKFGYKSRRSFRYRHLSTMPR